MKHRVLDLCSTCGVGQAALYTYNLLSRNSLIQTNFTVETGQTSEGCQGTVLFPYHHSAEHTYKYAVMASAFENSGYDTVFTIIDDADLLCNVETSAQANRRAFFEINAFTAKKILDKFGHNWIELSNFNSEIKDDYSPSTEQMIDSLSRASVRKARKKYNINDNFSMDLADQFYQTGTELYNIFRQICNLYNIDIAISHDPLYILGGIPLRAASETGAYAYSCAFGWKDQSIVISNICDRNSFPHFEQLELIKNVLDKKITEAENNRIDEILNNRKNGGKDARVQYSSTNSNTGPISKDCFSIGMFTNLIWDGSLEVEDCPYPNVFNWIQESIEHVSQIPETELLIKTHPAEQVHGTNESVTEWIRAEFEEIPQSVTIIEPDEDVNTYEMIQEIDAGIVYNSTVGLEMAATGLPVITAGETHYQNLEITYDPDTKKVYRDMLTNINDIESDQHMRDRARKYLYFLFEEKHIDFPFIKKGSRGSTFMSIDRSDLSHEGLKQIVQHTSQGEPVLNSVSNLAYSK